MSSSTRARALLILAAAGFLAFLLLRVFTSPEVELGSGRLEAAGAELAREARDGETEAEREADLTIADGASLEDARRATGAASRARFRARLVDRTGTALAGLRVRSVHDPEGASLEFLAFFDPTAHPLFDEATTGLDGAFELSLPADGFLVLDLEAQSHVLDLDNRFFAGGDRDVDVGSIVCREALVLRGRVVDAESSAGIAAARVHVRHGSKAEDRMNVADTVSAADGSFVLRGVCAGSWVVTARGAAHETASLESSKHRGPIVLALRENGRGIVRVRADALELPPRTQELDRTLRARGVARRSMQVVDDSSRPIPGARVLVAHSGSIATFVCDRDGRVTFPMSLPGGRRCMVHVEADGFGREDVDLAKITAAKDPVLVRLRRAGGMDILCLDSSGKPLRFCPVWAWHVRASGVRTKDGWGERVDFSATSDSRGVVHARGLAPGEWRIRLVKQGGSFRMRPFWSSAPASSRFRRFRPASRVGRSSACVCATDRSRASVCASDGSARSCAAPRTTSSMVERSRAACTPTTGPCSSTSALPGCTRCVCARTKASSIVESFGSRPTPSNRSRSCSSWEGA